MNASSIVKHMLETGPDDIDPKAELERIPDKEYFVDPADWDGNIRDADYVWRKALADQMNRVLNIVMDLRRAGQRKAADDIESLLVRVSEYEEIHPISRRPE